MQTPEQIAQWQDELSRLEAQIPSLECRVFPSSFDPDDPQLRGFPAPLDYGWPSLAAALRHARCQGAMMRLPLFWQAEAPLFAACKEARAFIFVNEESNMPLGAAALRQANVDAVVTTNADAHAFSAFLFTAQAPKPRLWVIVHPIENIEALPAATIGSVVFQEAHLVPGVPALVQCPALAARRDATFFHAAEHFTLSASARGVHLSLPTGTLPFAYPSDLPLEPNGGCSCGKTSWKLTRYA